MPTIHPSAIVDPAAVLADDVKIGPGVVIEGRCIIGPGCEIYAHSILQGSLELGAGCKIGPAAYVGLPPNHVGYKGQDTWLIVGAGTVMRENTSAHRSMKPGRENATTIGQRCYLMSVAHVGHDCKIEDDVILANNVLLGGHVTVGSRAFLGGGSGVHQFVRVGRVAIVGGMETATRDVLPFGAMRFAGHKGYNAIGCRRAGLSNQATHDLRAVFHAFHTHQSRPAFLEAVQKLAPFSPEVQEIIDFVNTTKRGITPSVHFLNASSGATREE